MTIGLQPPQSGDTGVLAAFNSVLAAAMPSNCDCLQGQANLIPEPKSADFAIFTPAMNRRLATNLDEFVDTMFTGDIADTLLTVSEMDYGELKVGSLLFAVDLNNPTTIVAQVSGPTGGAGTYTVDKSQTLSARIMAAGIFNATQAIEWTIQVDVHGPASADNAARFTTLFRDDWATQLFKAKFPDGSVMPLYADDARQIAFLNAEKQWEDRWSIDACLQVNATVHDIPQQFFTQVVVEFIPVDLFDVA